MGPRSQILAQILALLNLGQVGSTLLSLTFAHLYHGSYHPPPPSSHTSVFAMIHRLKVVRMGFPGGAVAKNPPANAGDTGSSPVPGRSHRPQSN